MALLFNPKVIILAGGLGTRLRSVVAEVPKVLAPVEGKPFLAVMLKWLKKNGLSHVTLSLGYKAEQVIAIIPNLAEQLSMTIDYVVEEEPIGTLGGLSLVLSKTNFEPCIVINGDTFVDIDLEHFYMTHFPSNIDAALALISVDDPARYGTVTVKDEAYIEHFVEKGQCKADSAWINAGVYYLSQSAITKIKSYRSGSIETDFFAEQPELIGYSKYSDTKFIDIGTPESYAQAPLVLKEFL